MRFKTFLEQENKRHEDEHFIAHIADEELISCIIQDVYIDGDKVDIIADCNDKPRRAGYQKDLSDKMQRRLAKHPHLAKYKVRVSHANVVPTTFPTEPDEHVYQNSLK
jgi:hypothetical protein